MIDIHHEGYAQAPLAAAFAYIDDYRNASSWMFGLTKLEPADAGPTHGLGAVYDGTFQVKPVKLSSRVEVTAWEQDSLIAMTSIKGFTNSSTWRFAAAGPERTKLSVKFSYELPGGLAGKALGRAMEPIVSMTVRHTDAALRKNIEAAYRAQR